MSRWLVLVLILASAASADDYVLEDIARNLDRPWSVAFLPNGNYLVTGLGGSLWRIDADGQTEIDGVPDTYVAGQGGFFDIVLDPDFEANSLVYLSYAEGKKRANRTAVLRAQLQGNALVDAEVIFRAEPDKNTAHHYGGRLAFLADGTLLITTGEGFRYKEEAQNLDSHFGKVIRINTDGSVPADNPFAKRSGIARKVWTYGHRNPQGLIVDPDSGTVWLHEHGPRGGDEVNRLEAGRNYGWPAITYGIDYSGAKISPYTELDGMEQPEKYWDPSIAPSGLALYTGEHFPDWQGSLFVGALRDQDVRRLSLDNGKIAGEEILFAEIGARIRDVRGGPDGYLYIVTDGRNGRLIRVRPN